MTTRIPTIQYAPNGSRNGALIQWAGLLNGDDGAAVESMDYAERTVQIEGTFGSGGSVTLRGSNDGANFRDLTDPQGNVITKGAAGLEVIAEGPRYVRPYVTAGDGSTNLTVTVWARRNR